MRVIFLLLISFNSFAQLTNYDRYDIHVNNGNQLKNEQKYHEAIAEYKLGLNAIDKHPRATPFFDLASCAIEVNDYDLSQKYISLGVSKGGAPFFYLNSYKGFDANFKQSIQWKQLVDNYNTLRKEYFSTIDNMDVYIQIETMIAEDQIIRTLGESTHSTVKEKEISDEIKQFQVATMMNIDTKNIEKLIEITKKYGWQDRAWLLLWHQRGTYKEDNDVWNFFIPIIEEEIAKGRIPRRFWAIFEDSKSLRDQGYTLYGELPGKVDEKVNDRRKAVNLPPLSQQEIDENNSDDVIILL